MRNPLKKSRCKGLALQLEGQRELEQNTGKTELASLAKQCSTEKKAL